MPNYDYDEPPFDPETPWDYEDAAYLEQADFIAAMRELEGTDA